MKTEKEKTLNENVSDCLKQLEIDLREGNLPLTQIISDFKEVLTDYEKEFIKKLKKYVNNLDGWNAYTFGKIGKKINRLAGKELI